VHGLFRSLLFRLDAERAHGITLSLAKLAGNLPPGRWLMQRLFDFGDARLQTQAIGLTFRNPVGLAAGYDKNGVAAAGLSALGFGHLEFGTVTRQPQAGNPRPRIHRLVEARAVVNSMGFPNRGVSALPNRLRAQAGPDTRVGVNLGKGRETPIDEAAGDYVALLREVHVRGLADYAAINISSPNTPDLRGLQARGRLEALLKEIAAARAALQPRLPILVKVAPDLAGDEIDDVLAAVTSTGMDGIIVANTTTSREGAPLTARATAVLQTMAERTRGELPLVGVGGIMSPSDALERIRAGAWLVQVYTGMVYAGPGLASAINHALVHECERQGVLSVAALRRQPVA
jgi:dihydroorotate dehydrogenase